MELPVEQAANLAGVPVATVRRWAATGLVKGRKISPRMWVVDLSDVTKRANARMSGKSNVLIANAHMREKLTEILNYARESDACSICFAIERLAKEGLGQ